MNKAYKSVWNDSLGAWVAVSEIDGSRGKRSGGSRLRRAAVLLGRQVPLITALVLAYPLALPSASAQTTVYGGGGTGGTVGTTASVCTTATTIAAGDTTTSATWVCTGAGTGSNSIATTTFIGTLAQAQAFQPVMGIIDWK